MAASSEENGITLLVDVKIYADKVDDFLAHFERMLKQIQKEPEFQSIEVFRSTEDPNHIHWLENWSTSMSRFSENILTKPYVQEYLSATALFCDGKRSKQIWNRLGGDFAIAKSGVYREPC